MAKQLNLSFLPLFCSRGISWELATIFYKMIIKKEVEKEVEKDGERTGKRTGKG